MNPFRVITLVILSLALILLFYVVVILIPERQSEYAQYQSTVQMNNFNQRHTAHEARMQQIAPDANEDSVQQALAKASADEERRQKELIEAEERAIIEAARAKEEAARAAEEAKPKPAPEPVDIVLGTLNSYNEQWASLIISPAEGAAINEGQYILIKRDKAIIAEACIDGKDEPTGQYTASLTQSSQANTDKTLVPSAGDIIVLSPFKTVEELRREAEMPATTPTEEQSAGGLQDIDADLIPMP